MAGYGRPLKGKTRRVPITVHTAIGILDIIDQYVEERNQEEKAYSRSDFYNEAARLYLEHLGRLLKRKRTRKRRKRTKTVPKFFRNRNKGDNMNNTNNKTQLKITQHNTG